jgi:hypothetical protein
MQVGHSMNVIAELPRYVDDLAIVVGLRVAAVDSFFVHLRLLIEFLVKPPDRRRPSIHREDYTAGFHLGSIETTLHSRLADAYELASRHVVHYGVDRVPTAATGVEYIGAARLRAHGDDALAAFALFVKHLRASANSHADDFDAALSEARSRQQSI